MELRRRRRQLRKDAVRRSFFPLELNRSVIYRHWRALDEFSCFGSVLGSYNTKTSSVAVFPRQPHLSVTAVLATPAFPSSAAVLPWPLLIGICDVCPTLVLLPGGCKNIAQDTVMHLLSGEVVFLLLATSYI